MTLSKDRLLYGQWVFGITEYAALNRAFVLMAVSMAVFFVVVSVTVTVAVMVMVVLCNEKSV